MYFYTSQISGFIIHKRFEIEDLVYLKSDRSYCDLFFVDGKKVTVTLSGGNVVKSFPEGKFIKIGRACFVNSDHIIGIRGNQVELTSYGYLDVQEAYRSHLKGQCVLIGRARNILGSGADSQEKDVLIGYEQSDECRYCGLCRTQEGHDGCVGALEGVREACCGHGQTSEAYIQFDHSDYKSEPDKYRITGRDAVTYIQISRRGKTLSDR